MKKGIKYESIPHYVQIETSYNCNARCVFCYNPRRNQPPNLDKMRKIVNEVAKAKIPHVQLTGGEISVLPTEFVNEIINKLSINSTVSIQTNGIKYIDGLTNNLAAVYVSLHGTKEYHNDLQQTGEWDTIAKHIQKYIKVGFEVNLDFTLTAKNYSNFEKIAMIADRWGVKQYSINKFQPAGIGAYRRDDLVPSITQFKQVVSQIIRLQKNTKLKLGFCTAIPYCLDERLPRHGLQASCGAGTYLLAISPDGEVRICNQSFSTYGNVLERDLLEIWRDKQINEFRDKSWVTKPCSDCFLFNECLGGCKVDNTSAAKYCVDYAIRGLEKSPINKIKWANSVKSYQKTNIQLANKIQFTKTTVLISDKFTKFNKHGRGVMLLTKHQTIHLDNNSVSITKFLLKNKKVSVNDIINYAGKNQLDTHDTEHLIKKLIFAEAVKIQ